MLLIGPETSNKSLSTGFVFLKASMRFATGKFVI